MAKKKSEAPTGDFSINALRSVLASSAGLRSVTEASSYGALVGVEIPSIAVQWMLSSNVLPLSRILEITGPPESCKSTFLYEIMRWFLYNGGEAVLFETEGKDNAGLRDGVLENDPRLMGMVTAVPVTQYEVWVGGAVQAFKFYRSKFESGPEFQHPVLISVDSLVAASMQKMLEEVDKDGHTGADFPRLPRALSNDFRTFNDYLLPMPCLFAFTNHSKQSINPMAGPTEYQLGGRGVAYHKSLSIRLAPAMSTIITQANRNGRRLKMSTVKNSIGQSKREIEVLLYFYQIENPLYSEEAYDTSKYITRVVFDWGEVDLKFLTSILSGSRTGFSAANKNALASVLDLHVVSKANSPTWVWSASLGVPESDPVPFTEAGRRLLANRELLRAVQDELGIKRYPVYQLGMDYNGLRDAFVVNSERRAMEFYNKEEKKDEQ